MWRAILLDQEWMRPRAISTVVSILYISDLEMGSRVMNLMSVRTAARVANLLPLIISKECLTMKLSYRGSIYETPHQPVETTDSQVIASYRGASYPIRGSVRPSTYHKSTHLIFLGASYCNS
jgi:Domain of unknown function (DUF4278)